MIERQLFGRGSLNSSESNYRICDLSVREDIKGARGLRMDFSLNH